MQEQDQKTRMTCLHLSGIPGMGSVTSFEFCGRGACSRMEGGTPAQTGVFG